MGLNEYLITSGHTSIICFPVHPQTLYNQLLSGGLNDAITIFEIYSTILVKRWINILMAFSSASADLVHGGSMDQEIIPVL